LKGGGKWNNQITKPAGSEVKKTLGGVWETYGGREGGPGVPERGKKGLGTFSLTRGPEMKQGKGVFT